MRPWSVVPGGVVLTVRLTPKGAADGVDGVETMADGRAVLKARVRAAPADGDANAALVKLLARALDVAARNIELTAGATARIKRLKIAGDPASLMTTLEKNFGLKAGA